MKIRNGFVSNSSSSSFLVKFPRTPESVEEVTKVLFGDKTLYFCPYGDENWTVEQVSKIVFRDIQEQTKNDVVQAKKMLSGCNESRIDPDDYNKNPNSLDWNHRDIDWDAYEKAAEEWAEERLEGFFSLKKIRRDKLAKIKGENILNIGGEVLYIFEYSDNGSTLGSAMEHGDLFDNLEHIRLSKH